MPLLSVAIPTYNRHEFLRTTLQALRGQARENVELVVVDNCSKPPVEAVVQEVLAGSGWTFRVVRNAANVGLCANILRCFEVALGDWLWVLSDDDVVRTDAVATLLQTLNRHPDLLFASFSLSVLPIEKEAIHDSVDSFFLALDGIRIIFLSAALYQRRELVRHLHLAYNFLDSGAPHTALLLLEGLTGAQCKLAYLPQEIVAWQPPIGGQRYSQFTVIGFFRLLALCHGDVRRHLAAVFRKVTPPPLRLLIHLARDAERGTNPLTLGAMLDQYLHSYSSLIGGIRGAFWNGPLRLLFHLCLRFPFSTLRFANIASKLLRGKELQMEASNVSLYSYDRAIDSVGRKA